MGQQETTARPAVTVARRIPATLALLAALLIAGVVWQGLWTPFEQNAAFDTVAYGLPALEAGRWWTPVTGTFFVNQPWVYALAVLGLSGMGYLEYRRGSRVALAYFTVGQLFSVLATALALWLFAMLPWPWAQTQATLLDVGPSGGAMACLAAAISLFVSPWRLRAWVVLLAFTFVAVLFWGALADLEHLMAVLMVLVFDRSLRPQRVSVREQRLIAFVGLLTLGAVQVITLLVPTSGPFGVTAPTEGPWLDVAVDTIVILVVANGMRRGRRWAWVVSVVLSILNIVSGMLLIVLVFTIGVSATQEVLEGDVSVAVATSVLWLLALAYLLLVRGAFRAHRGAHIGDAPRPALDEVKELIHRDGGGTLSWMTTWEGNSYAREGDGVVAYQRRMGVALALGDPLGPAASRPQTVRAFIARAEQAGVVPCFFSAGEATRAAVPEGWRSLVVADDTIVDLPGLAFTGKAWSAVRTSLNRATRENMTFRMTRLAEEPWGVRQQLRAISESWVGDKDLPEMGFTLGTLQEAADPEVRVALAVSPDGDVDGFLSWLPVYGEGRVRGWTLDLMRRREGGFGPVMEFLIGSSAQFFAEEGAEVLSLSGAPLTHEYPADAGIIADITQKLAEALEPVYGFASLHRFKQKFNPRYETMYLLYRDESDLTRIGAGLTRAFLPHATLRQFAAAGFDLVRHEG